MNLMLYIAKINDYIAARPCPMPISKDIMIFVTYDIIIKIKINLMTIIGHTDAYIHKFNDY